MYIKIHKKDILLITGIGLILTLTQCSVTSKLTHCRFSQLEYEQKFIGFLA